MEIEYNKNYYKPNSLTLKNLKKRKIPAPIACWINKMSDNRAIDWCENLKNEQIWEELTLVENGEHFIEWCDKLRSSYSWAYDLSHDFRNGDESRYQEGYFITDILLEDDYWKDSWLEVKNTSYLSIEMQNLAYEKYKNQFIPITDNVNFSKVKSKALAIRDRFGLKTIKTVSSLSHNEVYALFIKLEESLEKITDVMGWDDVDFGANRLSLFIGLGIKEQSCFYDPILDVINLPIDKLDSLVSQYAFAIDYKLGIFLQKDKERNIFHKNEYATEQALNVVLFSETENELVKKSIKSKFTPKLKVYEKKVISYKIVESVPKLLNSLIDKTNDKGLFKAFVDNRNNEYSTFLTSYISEKTDKKELKKLWSKWKYNTLKFVNSDELQIVPRINLIQNYVKAITVIIDDLLKGQLDLSWFWITIVYELEKNYFHATQDSGVLSRNIYFTPNKSSYTELFSRSFSAYISNEINEDNLFIKSYDGDVRYPQGYELNNISKWWRSHLRYFNRIWSV